MSSNKTTNYNLHSWLPEDDFLRSEMNENFSKLDTAARMVAGSYTGDEQAQRLISLGFTPKAVFVTTKQGYTGFTNCCMGGMALPGKPSHKDLIEITNGGFFVRHREYLVSTNDDGYVFYYWAMW